MKIVTIKSSDKQNIVSYVSQDAIVHLDEQVETDIDGNISYKYLGVLISDALQYTDESLIANAKKFLKQHKLATLTVTTASGKTFDANETARNNMLVALQAASILNIIESEWKLADNTVAIISTDELKEALSLSIQAVGDLVLYS